MEAAVMLRPGEDSGLTVKGGARGLTVEYQELQAAGQKLDVVVGRLQDLQFRGADASHRLCGLSAAPEAAARAASALDAAVAAVGRTIEDLQDAATGLRSAGQNYLEAEGRVEAAVKALPGASLALAVLHWKESGGGYPGRLVTELLVPRQDEAVLSLLTALASGLVGRLRPVEVRKVEGNHGAVAVSGTARGLLERSSQLLNQPPGVIEILTVDNGGRQVRIVTLPGTQPGSMIVGANPFDPYGNAEARAQDSRYVAEAVAEALRQAGAAADDTVILAGYSQGGIHAVNTGIRLAEDGEFSVGMIVTAGSPGGDRDIPGGIKVLHLEHEGDWVPGADGASNPDTPDRITVTGRAPAPLLPEAGAGLGPAHSLGVYLDMAAAADASADPSLRDSLTQLGQLIGPGAATRSLYRLSRARPPAPAPAPAARPGAASRPEQCLRPGRLPSGFPGRGQGK